MYTDFPLGVTLLCNLEYDRAFSVMMDELKQYVDKVPQTDEGFQDAISTIEQCLLLVDAAPISVANFHIYVPLVIPIIDQFNAKFPPQLTSKNIEYYRSQFSFMYRSYESFGVAFNFTAEFLEVVTKRFDYLLMISGGCPTPCK